MRRLALALAVLASPALAQEAAVRFTPHISAEADLRLYSATLPARSEGPARGTSIFLRGEILAGLHLAPGLSIQASLHLEPIQEVEPMGGVVGFRNFGGFLDSLFLDWRVTDTLRLELGKFTAPFGYGYHAFPGILPRVRAHEVYWIREAVGAAGTWTFLSHPTFGEHDLSAAVFMLDRSFLSETFGTRRRCCEVEAERYTRNTAAQGGAGNTGRLNNVAVALDGDSFSWLPGFSYHLAFLSRGAGSGGTARETGYAIGARYEHVVDRRTRMQFFFEHVGFPNFGGAPLEEEIVVRERRRFTTIGVQARHEVWRGAVVWQRDERSRPAAPVPTARFLEVSVGRELGAGFGVDLGYQYGRVAQFDGLGSRDSHAVLAMLTWQRRR
jgi:hypothetical protein